MQKGKPNKYRKNLLNSDCILISKWLNTYWMEHCKVKLYNYNSYCIVVMSLCFTGHQVFGYHIETLMFSNSDIIYCLGFYERI